MLISCWLLVNWLCSQLIIPSETLIGILLGFLLRIHVLVSFVYFFVCLFDLIFCYRVFFLSLLLFVCWRFFWLVKDSYWFVNLRLTTSASVLTNEFIGFFSHLNPSILGIACGILRIPDGSSLAFFWIPEGFLGFWVDSYWIFLDPWRIVWIPEGFLGFWMDYHWFFWILGRFLEFWMDPLGSHRIL